MHVYLSNTFVQFQSINMFKLLKCKKNSSSSLTFSKCFYQPGGDLTALTKFTNIEQKLKKKIYSGDCITFLRR